MSEEPSRTERPSARRRARELAVQAIYQRAMAGHDVDTLLDQFLAQAGRADTNYLRTLIRGIVETERALDELLTELIDRPMAQLDTVEHAILRVGLYELRACADVPYRVIVNEGVALARRFGAEDGHKYVNAVLDRAARQLRTNELSGD